MSNYAIIETGSKQYVVQPNTIIEIERLSRPEGEKEVVLDKVLFFSDGEKCHIGTPWISGARVLCESLGDIRGPKVISFKFRRRKASRRKKGHRQELSRLRVKEIKITA
ncbi:MAG TPA: 50S ribosomal protein L21 [bacterium]|nr:50S ribosomal protein L21 [bacterium]